jgi:hypothetical protein
MTTENAAPVAGRPEWVRCRACRQASQNRSRAARREQQRESARAWRAANQERVREMTKVQWRRRRARRISAGVCQECAGPMPEGKTRGLCAVCAPIRAGLARQFYHRLKATVFAHYGSRCACCGESEPLFLSVDHVNGHTVPMRERIGRGYRTYKDIINSGFPDDIRILCINCNFGRERNGGVCPHDTARVAAADREPAG